MQYELVNVNDGENEPFTGELIVPAVDGFEAVVGVVKHDGIEIYSVPQSAYTETGQSITRTIDGDPVGNTPQLV